MKKFYFKLLILAFVFSVFFISDVKSQTKNIKIMYFNVPPLIFVDETTGKLSGATYDFLETYISKELDVKFIWDQSATAVPRQLLTLENSSDSASAVLVYSKEREGKVTFTAEPYINTVSAIAVLKSNKLNKVNSVEDIVNLKIGFGQGVFMSPFMKDKRLKFDLISTGSFIEPSFKKLIINRIDAVYAPNKLELLYQIHKLKLEDQVKLLELPEKRTPNHIAFSKNSGDIAQKYNQAFNKLDGKNLYKKILSKYIDTSNL
jgi:polar amino acid transport system substrate-binding protein